MEGCPSLGQLTRTVPRGLASATKKVPLEALGLKATSVAFIWGPWGYSGGSLICLPGILQIIHQPQKHPEISVFLSAF
jgi:hypothetical protein